MRKLRVREIKYLAKDHLDPKKLCYQTERVVSCKNPSYLYLLKPFLSFRGHLQKALLDF